MKKFQQYKQQRIANNPEFWDGYQERSELFKLLEKNLPNEETGQAIYEAEQGINLVVCEDADDVFKKLGI